MSSDSSQKDPAQELFDLSAALQTRLAYENESGEDAFAFDPMRPTHTFTDAPKPKRPAPRKEEPVRKAPEISLEAPTPSVAKEETPKAPSSVPVPTPAPATTPAPAATRTVPQARVGRIENVVSGLEGLNQVREILGDCNRCRLHEGRENLVFGEGNPQADLMFIGEGPGAQEDKQGRPFVGPAGQLLERMIVAMGLQRDSVYIANVVKCRPPGNRDPELDEQHACRPFLLGQIEAIQPKVIVTLGRTATQTVMETNERISRMRGRWAQHPHCDVAVMPTYHPAAILRNRQLRRPVWEDLQLAMDRLGLPRNP